ncbi:MAG TPA: SRPBCC family protein [Pseudonocardia sp.]|uniref:SRPBCC family protein n=1 Tax=Pseudonocardia sp. TaxID=60912 RepID=UPI002C41C922|nr:SRPBCC family protein [Pseudonocardia sp.]HTF54603.1 SRPBCC family protein [Pseudonocardia sp.]
MTELAYVSSTLDADITAVWSVLGDFHGLPVWMARARESVAEGGREPGAVGSVRCLTLDPNGRRTRERLVHYDGADHRYSYEFDGVNPFPVSSYLGTVHLLPITDTGRTFVEWFGEFDPLPGTDQAAVEALRDSFTGFYTEFIGDLRTHLAAA